MPARPAAHGGERPRGLLRRGDANAVVLCACTDRLHIEQKSTEAERWTVAALVPIGDSPELYVDGSIGDDARATAVVPCGGGGL